MMLEEAKNEERHDGRGKLKTCFHYFLTLTKTLILLEIENVM